MPDSMPLLQAIGGQADLVAPQSLETSHHLLSYRIASLPAGPESRRLTAREAVHSKDEVATNPGEWETRLVPAFIMHAGRC
jgi:hypothetical protein